ncbi:DUF1002 domain-containing protein [Bacillus carboniphilus]|uniref:DUF1002 domain-containing protein n=1 Tax=Bacillus carboniphilus TaxID=86663 RepID=A0ABY9JWN2_9BACI|nr:DUF1002 domain-containing protein [Bacillus carboniphilus]WLR43796.1 DUF1002 domain-containing protein [Bacillus carboniphilus]
MKKSISIIILAAVMLIPSVTLADAVVGDSVITLGNDLTKEQRDELLKEMDATGDEYLITVTNQEEHEYLGNYISKAQIGSRALSSSKITIEEKNSGLTVETNKINWVTDEMYLNALMTAGVKDASVYVTAPFEVSGTAALTGLIKAYEHTTGEEISEDVKQIANEELVETAKLADEVGSENASALIAKVKEQIAEKGMPENEQDLRELIEQSAQDLDVTLSEEDMNRLTDLFNKMKDVNIDWDLVSDQLDKVKDKITNFIESEEGQNFFQSVKEFFVAIWEAIISVFNGEEQTE